MMPNWVTNKVKAPSHVIRAMLDAEGRVDFEIAAPFPGPYGKDWGGYSFEAEEAAEIICGVPVNDHPLIAALQAGNRRRFDIKKMSEESFEQFIGMVRNWRACGYLHPMDFNRKVWGTKWNAYEPKAYPDDGHCEFNTAWSCPMGFFEKLSERFPDDLIEVTYADEDIGSNCGIFAVKSGKIIESDIAPRCSELDDSGKKKWKSFAYQVTGREPYEE